MTRFDHRTFSPARTAAPAVARPASRTSTSRATAGLVGAIALAASVLGAGQSAAAPAPVAPPNMKPAPISPHRLPNAIDGFAGRTYESVAVFGGVIPGGGPLRLAFGRQGALGLTAGCNQHVGRGSITGDQLRIGRLASTMMACPGPRADADRWLTTFVSVPLTLHAIGPVLTLSSPRQTVILVEHTR
ncbi:META domain-containing protein [Gordonia sp. NPDC003424]